MVQRPNKREHLSEAPLEAHCCRRGSLCSSLHWVSITRSVQPDNTWMCINAWDGACCKLRVTCIVAMSLLSMVLHTVRSPQTVASKTDQTTAECCSTNPVGHRSAAGRG